MKEKIALQLQLSSVKFSDFLPPQRIPTDAEKIKANMAYEKTRRELITRIFAVESN